MWYIAIETTIHDSETPTDADVFTIIGLSYHTAFDNDQNVYLYSKLKQTDSRKCKLLQTKKNPPLYEDSKRRF